MSRRIFFCMWMIAGLLAAELAAGGAGGTREAHAFIWEQPPPRVEHPIPPEAGTPQERGAAPRLETPQAPASQPGAGRPQRPWFYRFLSLEP